MFGGMANKLSMLRKKSSVDVTPDPIDANPDDDFGFSESWETFGDSKSYSPTQQIDL